jgi:tetratricopeptide (TPR) repeat protein
VKHREADTEDYGKLFEQGIEAGRKREYAEAAVLFGRVIAGTDRYPQALLYLGRSYHALGDLTKAVRMLASYARLRPESVAGRFFLGRSCAALGLYTQAVRHLREAVRRAPEFAHAYGLLGYCLMRARRPVGAVNAFRSALRLQPDNQRLMAGYLNASLVAAIRLFSRGNHVDSAQHFTEILRYRPDAISAHLYLAKIYRELGKGNMALLHIDRACALSPQDPMLHLQKALIHLEMGQPEAAKEEIRVGKYFMKTPATFGSTPQEVLRFLTTRLFMDGKHKQAIFYGTRLLKASYKDVKIHAIVAEAYRSLGDMAKARNHYMRAIENDRDSLELRYGLLGVLWELGETGEVLNEARRILQKNAGDPMARYFFSLALSRSDESLPTAISALQDQIRLRGPDHLLMEALGSAYVRAGLPQLAEGWYARILKVAPGHRDSLLALVDIHKESGSVEKERGALAAYLECFPDDSKRRKGLVKLLLDSGEFGPASEQIARLLPAEPRSSKLRALLALCYRRSGKYEDALILLKDLLRDDPSSEELTKAAVYCLDKIGARSVAVTLVREYAARHGARPSLLLMLGVLYFQDGALEKSAEVFRRVIADSPREWKAHRNLGMVYRKMGNTQFAESFLARAEQYRAEGKASS